MSNMKFTPGPWFEWPDRRATVNGYLCKIIGNEQASVCFMSTAQEPANIANTKLISTAPELLTMIQSLVAMLDDYGFPDDQPANYRTPRSIGNKSLRDWHSDARAAIAKAANS